jgi:hypothetical protein
MPVVSTALVKPMPYRDVDCYSAQLVTTGDQSLGNTASRPCMTAPWLLFAILIIMLYTTHATLQGALRRDAHIPYTCPWQPSPSFKPHWTEQRRMRDMVFQHTIKRTYKCGQPHLLEMGQDDTLML